MATVKQARTLPKISDSDLIGIGVLGILLAVGLALAAITNPVIAILGMAGIIVAFLSIRLPEAATLTFIFLLYTNAPLIGINIHGVPRLVGGMFPLMLVIPFFYYVALRGQKIVLSSQLYLLGVLLLVQMIATMISIDVLAAWEELLEFIVEGVIIYFLIINVVRTQATLQRVVFVILLAAIILGAFPLYQELTKTYDNNYWGFAQIEEQAGFTAQETLVSEVRQQRLSGAIGEVNRFAQIMLMLLVIAVSQLGRGHSWGWQLFTVIAAAIALAGFVLPFSRGAAVGFAVMVLIGVLLRLIAVRYIVMFSVIALISVVFVPQYTARLLSIQDSIAYISGNQGASEADGATKGRITEMWAAAIVYSEHPIVGVGPGMYKFYSEDVGNQLGIRRLEGERRAHNLYLDIAANTGTIGFIATMGMVIMTVWGLVKIQRNPPPNGRVLASIATGLALAIIAYMTTGFFLHFAYIRYFWTTLALGAAAIQIAKDMEIAHTNNYLAETNSEIAANRRSSRNGLEI